MGELKFLGNYNDLEYGLCVCLGWEFRVFGLCMPLSWGRKSKSKLVTQLGQFNKWKINQKKKKVLEQSLWLPLIYQLWLKICHNSSLSTPLLPQGAHFLPSPLSTVTFLPSDCSGRATISRTHIFPGLSLCALDLLMAPTLWIIAPPHLSSLENGRNQAAFKDWHADLA